MEILQRRGGFSLIEFMIAITVSLVILAALSGMFVANSRARVELERANQQIENGRYAMMALTDDLQLAGYWSQFNMREAVPAILPMPGSKPEPCGTSLADLTSALPLHVQGYDNSSEACNDAGGSDLLADYRAGTDVLVIRRASTCIRGNANCPDIPGAPYFQASLCEPELNVVGGTERFRLNTNIGSLNRTQRNCATLAPIRQYLVHVYFVTNNDRYDGTRTDCDRDGAIEDDEYDCIPTLKRAELTAVGGAAQFRAFSIANGIENMQIEYGIDLDEEPAPPPPPDGIPDVFTASPDRYNRADPAALFANCGANPDCVENWYDVVSVKVSLLARNPTESRDHEDTKVYALGLQADGSVQYAKDGGAAFEDGFKRHVYQSAIRLNNAATRRE